MRIRCLLRDCAALVAIIVILPSQIMGSESQYRKPQPKYRVTQYEDQMGVSEERKEILAKKRKEILDEMIPNEEEEEKGIPQEEIQNYLAQLRSYSQNYVLPPPPISTKRVRRVHEEGLDKYQDRLKDRQLDTTSFEQLRQNGKNFYRPSVKKVQDQLTITEKMVEMVRFRRFHGEDYGMARRFPGRWRDEKHLLFRNNTEVSYDNNVERDNNKRPRRRKPPFNSTNNHLVWG